MKNEHQGVTHRRVNFMDFFPSDVFEKPRHNQVHTLRELSEHIESMIYEEPTGSGKTGIGIGFLRGIESYAGKHPLFYLVPNKTHVDQVKKQFPNIKVAYGRAEYPCLFYGETGVTAQESPCYLLPCGHRVNQETGETEEPGAKPCPYYQAKWEAKQGGIVVATAAFYLYTYFFAKEWKKIPAGIVVDEAHRLADILRHSLSFEISDYHLGRSIELLRPIDGAVAEQLAHFRKRMIHFVKKRSMPNKDLLLKENEIGELIDILSKIQGKELMGKVKQQVKGGTEDRETLKQLQDITYGIGRYMRSLKYAIPAAARHPLSYTYGYVREDMGEADKVKYKLCIRSYYVAGIIRKMFEGARTLSYSATVGNVEILRQETGLQGEFESLVSDFDPNNRRLFLPTDVRDLSHNGASKGDKNKTMRLIARSALDFSRKDLRSLILVVSDIERARFMEISREEGLNVLTYDANNNSRQIMQSFKSGHGSALIGTVANYCEGIDLPDGIAPVTFILRPDYPHPYDPMTQFEEGRFSKGILWSIWQWRVIIRALQGSGRNVRSAEDRGVTFFMSRQFKKFLWGSLPSWLRDSYRGNLSFDECVKETKRLLLK